MHLTQSLGLMPQHQTKYPDKNKAAMLGGAKGAIANAINW
jgi:hypothetical protein